MSLCMKRLSQRVSQLSATMGQGQQCFAVHACTAPERHGASSCCSGPVHEAACCVLQPQQRHVGTGTLES